MKPRQEAQITKRSIREVINNQKGRYEKEQIGARFVSGHRLQPCRKRLAPNRALQAAKKLGGDWIGSRDCCTRISARRAAFPLCSLHGRSVPNRNADLLGSNSSNPLIPWLTPRGYRNVALRARNPTHPIRHMRAIRGGFSYLTPSPSQDLSSSPSPNPWRIFPDRHQ
jgi:hypothetical protein